MNASDAHYMSLALRLARKGLYGTDPNPRVGCVLVRGDRVVGRGWHARAGAPHAEAHALAEAGEAARGATAYVTLEPCCHHGRTPPCTEALLAAGVARVVAAIADPSPHAAGRGLAALAAAGVAVESGLLAPAAEALNAGFISRLRRGRPLLRAKLAMSLDARTAMASGESRWITGEPARRDVQRWRARSSAIVTGIGTLLADDPALTVRGAAFGTPPRQPLRVVLDSGLRTPPSARLLAGPGRALIVCAQGRAARARRQTLEQAGAEVLELPADGERVALAALVAALVAREANEVLIECGPTLAGAFVAAGLLDELLLYAAPRLLGDGARGLIALPGLERLADSVALDLVDARAVGRDLRLIARPSTVAGLN